MLAGKTITDCKENFPFQKDNPKDTAIATVTGLAQIVFYVLECPKQCLDIQVIGNI